MWTAAGRVDADPEVAAWLRQRGIDPAVAADRDLARALRPDACLPGWAGFGRRTWAQTGHRVVVPWYDAAGALVSLHARLPGTPPEGGRKGLAPRGASTIGLIMADALGRLLLAGDPPEWFDPDAATVAHGAAVLVAEGLPDFLTLATLTGDAGLDVAPAVLGFAAGGPTADLAARLPDGWTVAVAGDPDEAGDRYVKRWTELLGGRCRVLRLVAGAEC